MRLPDISSIPKPVPGHPTRSVRRKLSIDLDCESPIAALTPQQYRAAVLLGQGYNVKDVAEYLGLRRESVSRWLHSKDMPEFATVIREEKEGIAIEVRKAGLDSARRLREKADEVLEQVEASQIPVQTAADLAIVGKTLETAQKMERDALAQQVPGEQAPSSGFLVRAEDAPISDTIHGFIAHDLGLPIEEFYPRMLFVLALIDRPDVRRAYFKTGKGGGKLLPVDTPIPTPTGWTTMGELKPGDLVFDKDGSQACVLWASGIRYGAKAYRLTFDDGSEQICDEGHLWITEDAKSRKNRCCGRHDGPQVRTTSNIVRTLTVPMGKARLSNHSVQVAGILDIATRPLPLDPYALGVWLGDGDSGGPYFTKHEDDIQIVHRIRDRGLTVHRRKSSRSAKWRIKEWSRKTLRILGLLFNKHIPEAYMRAGTADRIQLLAGLLDTDGSAAPDGGVQFCSTREKLAQQVLELVRTLGFKPTIRRQRARLYGKDCGWCWRVAFRPNRQVFTLTRKAQRLRFDTGHKGRTRTRFIVAAREVEPTPMRCITVSSPSKTYLCGRAMIPTHNSTTAEIVLLRSAQRLCAMANPARRFNLRTGKKLGVMNLSASGAEQAQLAIFEDFKRDVKGAPWFEEFAKPVILNESVTFPTGVVAICGNSSSKGAEGVDLFAAVVDEICRLPETASGEPAAAQALLSPVEQTLVSRFPQDGKIVVISWPEHRGDFLHKEITKRLETETIKEDLTQAFLDSPLTRGTPEQEAERREEISKPPFAGIPVRVVVTNEGTMIVEAPVWMMKPDADLPTLSRIEKTDRRLFYAMHAAHPIEQNASPYVMDCPAVRRRANPARVHPFDDAFLHSLMSLGGDIDEAKKAIAESLPDWFHGRDDVLYYGRMDLGVQRDACGIAVAHYDEGKISYDVLLELRPEPGVPIRIKFVRGILVVMRDLGFDFGLMEFDSFEGQSNVQEFSEEGFRCEIKSVDRSRRPYDVWRSWLIDGKLDYYEYEPFFECCESLVDLVRKIDHKPVGGKKDVTDAAAGLVPTILYEVLGIEEER